mmetsp:Transcript_66292/g.183058  ORF Transcript_66292/g.183058 Transcript_66292/m.183058 type:complete len:127 (+) Transcript_66292:171-551(+)
MSALELMVKDEESEGSKLDLNGEVHSIAGQWLALSLDSKKQTPTEVLPDGRVLFDGKVSLHTNFRFWVDTGIKPFEGLRRDVPRQTPVRRRVRPRRRLESGRGELRLEQDLAVGEGGRAADTLAAS